MSYVYTTFTFSDKDGMLDSNPLKILTGQEFEDEFVAIASASVASDAAIALRMPLAGGAFGGHVTGTTMTLSGDFGAAAGTFTGVLDALSIDGGTY